MNPPRAFHLNTALAPHVLPFCKPTHYSYMLQVQRLVLVGADGTLPDGTPRFHGEVTLTFNGDRTAAFTVEELVAGAGANTTAALNASQNDAALLVKAALESLPSISVIGVDAELSHNGSAAPPSVILTLTLRFHEGELVPTPLNLGPLPQVVLNVGRVAGVINHSACVVVPGKPPAHFAFPEQQLRLNGTTDDLAALDGTFQLGFKDVWTTTLTVNASASTLRDALMALPTVGELEVLLTDTPYSRTWTVRFYAEGDPPHIGPQSLLQVNASDLGGEARAERRRRLSVGLLGAFTVEVSEQGGTPFSSEDVDDAVLIVSDVTNVSALVELVQFTPPMHICGDGVRSTAEGCDDNNTVGGDGCDSLCRLEMGWKCASSSVEGSGVGGVDT
jgi:cysteine-rich repeat protein